jgi:hypothetical protein
VRASRCDAPELKCSVHARVGERSIDSAFCCGHRRRSDGLLTEYPCARHKRRPLPDAALNALNDCIFDASMFHALRLSRVPRKASRRSPTNLVDLGAFPAWCRCPFGLCQCSACSIPIRACISGPRPSAAMRAGLFNHRSVKSNRLFHLRSKNCCRSVTIPDR